MQIDLRSDTLTKPTPGMLAAMSSARVGDDVYEEDPTINELQERVADLFNMEAALFCPSGTMCNQIAIRLHTRPQDEVICYKNAHVFLYEGGGIAANSLCSVHLIEGDYGRIKAEEIAHAVKPDDPHFPRTSLVCLENTVNKGGGAVYRMGEIARISAICDEYELALHLDGARLWNAIIASKTHARDYGHHFDTISVCLSKGLGAPVGSVLIGSTAHIKEAKRVRKLMGGGMRQAGYLAAAGLYAIDHHIERLREDHERASRLANSLKELPWIEEMFPVETNIVVFKPNQAIMSSQIVRKHLKEAGILTSGFGPGYIRLVTHLDITDQMIERTEEVLKQLGKQTA